MIKKLLIANRGEIVCRIHRTCARMGIRTATVHSTADRDGVHVRTVGESVEIGPAPSAQSYLNIAAVLAAAKAVGADAIHPGIGFLSEEPAFAEAASEAGLLFIGPSADSLRRFGDKWSAKHEARKAGVPVIGGSEGSSNDPAELEELIRKTLRLPVVLKAAAGGGGRGVRIVRELDGLAQNIESAMREAKASFGRGDLIVEEFITDAQHIEVQVAGDGHGDAIHMFERECSLQRRFQKVVEEAPAFALADDLRQRILADAVRLAKSVKYANLGTVEFLVSGGRHLFLECNPRLQVEHTVTEAITGLDLVELQLRIAAGRRLPLAQGAVTQKGHAVQVRVYAEDASEGFAPSTGLVTDVVFPMNARIETAVEAGSVISPYYDPMIAKIIVHAADRAQAVDQMSMALKNTVIAGVETNIPFLLRLLDEPVVRNGTGDNRFIDRELERLGATAPASKDDIDIAAALAWSMLRSDRPASGLWSSHGRLANWAYEDGEKPHGPPAFLLQGKDERTRSVTTGNRHGDQLVLAVDGVAVQVGLRHQKDNTYQVSLDRRVITVSADLHGTTLTTHGPGGRHVFEVLPYLKLDAASDALEASVRAPMMGTILKIQVAVGASVKKGDVLVVEESMKMEMSLNAPADGIVSAIRCEVGAVVARNQVLVEIEPETGESR